MKPSNYAKLKIGDRVVLSNKRRGYHDLKKMAADHPLAEFVSAGMEGIVSAIKVPAVWSPNGSFVCVDFPDRPIVYSNSRGEVISAVQRVCAMRGDLL
jgi:hypothetical protein